MRRATWVVRAVVAGTIVASGVGAWRAAAAPAQAAPASGDQALGRQLYQHDCAVCHGPSGEGSARGPEIASRGLADIDFMITTGRMPIDAAGPAPVKRQEVRYTSDQIQAILAYTSTFVHGEPIPDVSFTPDDIPHGGEVYRLNCAACHHVTGSGGVLAYGVDVPALHEATAVQTYEALRVGPGQMPAFSPEVISDADANAVAAYVNYLNHPRDRGGIDLGHLGPVPEGAVALLVGLGALVLITRWLGTRERPPDELHVPAFAFGTAPPSVDGPGGAEGVAGWMRARAAHDPPMQATATRKAAEHEPRAEDRGLDVLDVLTRDHDHLERLLKQLAAPPGAPTSLSTVGERRRAELARVIAGELHRHERAEQTHLWPAVQEALDDGDEVADRARREEDHAVELVARLERTGPEDPAFDDLVEELSDALRRHVAFEDDVFLRLRSELPEEARVTLGRRITEGRPPDGQ